MATSKTKGTTNNSNAPTASTNTTSAGGYLNSNSAKHNGTIAISEQSTKRNGKGKEVIGTSIDFNTFEVSVLRRYKRIHKLKVKEYASKEELVSAVSKHYQAQTPKEVDAIAAFIYSVHHQGSSGYFLANRSTNSQTNNSLTRINFSLIIRYDAETADSLITTILRSFIQLKI
ncbi:10965_t:CDS:2 [Acaulospora morrowiae]|uniref:10965_t:CDS:1 n=1 Tax=Acaulospora morrowiae TaxID=94023 RepID=A0A9N9BYW1_9GLOM|nr:10965_t:CDS:2 [Acaulospora morrowiae]